MAVDNCVAGLEKSEVKPPVCVCGCGVAVLAKSDGVVVAVAFAPPNAPPNNPPPKAPLLAACVVPGCALEVAAPRPPNKLEAPPVVPVAAGVALPNAPPVEVLLDNGGALPRLPNRDDMVVVMAQC